MPSDKKPPVKPTVKATDEVVWMKCRGRKSCEGNQAKVLLKRDEGFGGTWVQYQCLTCNTPFGIRF